MIKFYVKLLFLLWQFLVWVWMVLGEKMNR
nr:MAG TPA: hypothetical protein [Caudoviricetes sp.]